MHYENYYEIEGTVNFRSYPITPGNHFYFDTNGLSQNSGIGRLIIKQNSSLITGWTELISYYQSGNTWRFTVPSNVNITQTIATNAQYIIRYNVYFTNDGSTGFTSATSGVTRFTSYSLVGSVY